MPVEISRNEPQLGLSHSTAAGTPPVENDRRFSRIVVTKPVRDFLRDTLPGLTIHPLAEALRNAARRTGAGAGGYKC